MKIMKAFIKVLVLTFTLSSGYIFSQCDNNVSTHPDGPTNDALPDDSASSVPYTMDERFLNGWNWWLPNSYNLTNMEFNPGQPYGSMTNIQSINQQPYYSYLKHNPLDQMSADQMKPENGWELLLVNMGRYPDNETVHENEELTVAPYLVFYHRYTGVVRVFVRYGYNTFPNDAINGVKINLYYDTDANSNNLSGLFRLGDGLDRCLDRPTKVSRLSAVAPPNGQANFWLSADFQTAYDPCVCQYPTNLQLDFQYFSTTSLKLHGRGIETQEEIIDANGNIKNKDFLSGIDFTSQLDAENGFVIYKNMIRLVEDYYEELDAYKDTLAAANIHNDQVERNLAILEVGQIALSAGVAAVTGTPELTSLITLLPNIKDWDDNGKQTFWKELDNVLFEGLDLLVKENFSKKDVPEAPSTPTASFSEMYFEGVMENRLSINGPQFHTPGSFKNSDNTVFNATNSVYSYPLYNNPLGVFALLEKPKVDISYSTIENYCINYASYFFDEGPLGETHDYDLYSASVTDVMQIKLKEKLKYTFNNSLNIKDYNITATLEVEGELEQPNTPELANGVYSDVYTTVRSSPGNNVNIESNSFNPKENETYKSYSINYDDLNFTTVSSPIDAFKNTVSSFGETRTLTHPEIDNYGPFEIEVYNESLFSSCSGMYTLLSQRTPIYTRKDIYLKLLVTVLYDGHKDDGEPHEYTYAFTYKISENDIYETSSTSLHPNLPGSSGDITQYPENLFLDSETFDGSPVEGCELNGNVYTCKARNDVELSGNFTVANNYDVFIEGGNKVRVLPDAVTPPEMVWQIEPVFDFSDPMPPVDKTYVGEFCQNEDTYKAREGTKIVQKDSTSESRTPEQSETFSFVLYPNPTNGTTTARIELESTAESELYITDINGRKLASAFKDQPLRAGVTEHQIPTETLNSGVYLVHLFIDGKHHVKRLVKQ